jgi:hypothetical protein
MANAVVNGLPRNHLEMYVLCTTDRFSTPRLGRGINPSIHQSINPPSVHQGRIRRTRMYAIPVDESTHNGNAEAEAILK